MYSAFLLLVEPLRQIPILRSLRRRLLHRLLRLRFRESFFPRQLLETFSIHVVLVHVRANSRTRRTARARSSPTSQAQTANQIPNHILLRARHVNLFARDRCLLLVLLLVLRFLLVRVLW